MIGRTYLERGRAVTVVVAYAAPSKARPLPGRPSWPTWRRAPRPAPRNVLVRRVDGQAVVRPFRGLRLPGAGEAR
ncbi:hypothetical protein [Streptosporangium carneum]|uniref:Uncharacterized protein n=1 Tax=Streptosporangium carneum TaxID=47481 RepID=A0A9W6HUT6_9ACTN|nr:hypothetical protein [Streptosporangium carneum]GLK06736.1 hypothetical protein GCM10017600_01410 [Streptosporangium carneum]